MAHHNHLVHLNYPHLPYVKLWLQKGLKSVISVLAFNCLLYTEFLGYQFLGLFSFKSEKLFWDTLFVILQERVTQMLVATKFVITVEQPIGFHTEIMEKFKDGQSLVGRKLPK